MDAVLPLRYDKCGCDTFPSYDRPRELGVMSLKRDGEVLFNKSFLRQLTTSTRWRNYDLNTGFETYIEEVSQSNALLRWIIKQKENVSSIGLNANVLLNCTNNCTVIAWRGLLSRMGLSLFYDDPWRCSVVFYKDAFIFTELTTEEKTEWESRRTERQLRMCYWGYSFEYVMTDPFMENEGSNAPRDGCFATVKCTRLNNLSILMAAEVDCIDTVNDEYVELKTNRQLLKPQHRDALYRYKHPKWWLQSYLIGIPRIVCGYRDEDGILRSVEYHSLDDMCKTVVGVTYQPVVMNTIVNILSFVMEHVRGRERQQFLVDWCPKTRRVVLSADATGEHALPEWFCDEFDH